jgi:hypothetical protein
MGMMAEILTPRVQHREKPDLCAEMSPIGSDGTQRLGGSVEQDLVDRTGILEGNRGDLVGNGEDDVEILRSEKLLPPSLDPFRSGEPLTLGTTTGTAAVVRDPSFATVVDCSTWPPSADVRQRSMAVIAARRTVDSEAQCCSRQAAP